MGEEPKELTDILFTDRDTGQEIKLSDTGNEEMPYAAIVRSEDGSSEIYPYAELDLDQSATRGNYVLRIYEKAKDDPRRMLRVAGVITGFAVCILATKRMLKRNND